MDHNVSSYAVSFLGSVRMAMAGSSFLKLALVADKAALHGFLFFGTILDCFDFHIDFLSRYCSQVSLR